MIRYQHVRFYKINIGEDFFFGKFRYTKTTFFTGRADFGRRAIAVMPWTRVRSTRPYGPVAPRIVGHIARVLAVNAPYLNVIKDSGPQEPS